MGELWDCNWRECLGITVGNQRKSWLEPGGPEEKLYFLRVTAGGERPERRNL